MNEGWLRDGPFYGINQKGEYVDPPRYECVLVLSFAENDTEPPLRRGAYIPGYGLKLEYWRVGKERADHLRSIAELMSKSRSGENWKIWL